METPMVPEDRNERGTAAGFENPPCLGEGAIDLGNVFERLDRSQAIEGSVGERHFERIALDQFRRRQSITDAARRA